MQNRDKELLNRIRQLPCCWCGGKWQSEPSHTFTKGMGGGQWLDHPLNLNPLCRFCHQSHHDGNEPKQSALVAIAALREGYTPDAAWKELYRLRKR